MPPALQLLTALALLLPSTQTQALTQPPVPRLITNLNTGLNGEGADPTDFHDVDGKLIFEAYAPDLTTRIVWQSDGTEAGTQPVENLFPDMVAAWDPRTWVKAGGKWFFVSARANANDPGPRLWSYEIGESFSLFGEVAAFPAAPQNLTACGSLLYFTVSHGAAQDTVLWRSDGTTTGTFPLPVQAPGFYSITQLTPSLAGDLLWFVADTTRLFRCGGTPQTTVEVDYTAQFPSGGISLLTAADDGVFFHHYNRDTFRSLLAKTGGSPASTVKIGGDEDSGPWRYPDHFFYWQGALYFSAKTPDDAYRLFRSDGSPQGTAAFDFFTAGDTSPPKVVGGTDKVIFLMADDLKRGVQLWGSDGSLKGTRQLTRNPKDTFVDRFKMVGGKLWFFGPGKDTAKLCVSDGTPKGTHQVKPRKGQGVFFLEEIASAGGQCFLSAGDPQHGLELWKTDGSTKGTLMVKDIVTGEASGVDGSDDVAVLGGYYYFTGRKQQGQWYQLWRSDGSRKGTTLVRDFVSKGIQEYQQPKDLVAAAGRLMFSQRFWLIGRDRVWSTKGTAATMIKEENFPEMPEAKDTAEAGGKGFTILYNGLHLLRPGHPQGPLQLTDGFFPDRSGYHNPLAAFDGRIYFSNHGPAGLWTSDGTATGTQIIKDTLSPPYDLIARNGSLYFLTRHAGAARLWKSDGSTAGTAEVAQVPLADCDWLTLEACGGKVYLFGKAAAAERRLYCWTDGDANAVLVKTFTATNAAAKLHYLHAGGNTLYFSFDDASAGAELWRSDGTAAGTFLLRDIQPGTAAAKPANLITAGPWTYFTADDGVNGIELWRTDGTPGETLMIADLHTGAPGSEPQGLRLVGGQLMFSAFTDLGRELWAIDKPADVINLGGGVIITVPPPLALLTSSSAAEDPGALLRHAFNIAHAGDTTPMLPGTGTSGYPAIATSGQVLRVEYLRRKDGSLIYTPQYSTSLEPGSFRPMTGIVTATAIDALWERVVAEQPYDPALTPRLFARVEVRSK